MKVAQARSQGGAMGAIAPPNRGKKHFCTPKTHIKGATLKEGIVDIYGQLLS